MTRASLQTIYYAGQMVVMGGA